jgi:hypothetical protein
MSLMGSTRDSLQRKKELLAAGGQHRAALEARCTMLVERMQSGFGGASIVMRGVRMAVSKTAEPGMLGSLIAVAGILWPARRLVGRLAMRRLALCLGTLAAGYGMYLLWRNSRKPGANGLS